MIKVIFHFNCLNISSHHLNERDFDIQCNFHDCNCHYLTTFQLIIDAGRLQDDELLSESSHFTFVYDDPEYSLVVLNARPEHSGVYTCTAKNLAGSNSCKAELTVHTGLWSNNIDRIGLGLGRDYNSVRMRKEMIQWGIKKHDSKLVFTI